MVDSRRRTEPGSSVHLLGGVSRVGFDYWVSWHSILNKNKLR